MYLGLFLITHIWEQISFFFRNVMSVLVQILLFENSYQVETFKSETWLQTSLQALQMQELCCNCSMNDRPQFNFLMFCNISTGRRLVLQVSNIAMSMFLVKVKGDFSGSKETFQKPQSWNQSLRWVPKALTDKIFPTYEQIFLWGTPHL